MSGEHDSDEEARQAGEKSERILENGFLSGAVGVAGPRLSASTLHGAEDDGVGAQVHDDRSWGTHAVEEGDPGDEPTGGGLRGLLRRWFGR